MKLLVGENEENDVIGEKMSMEINRNNEERFKGLLTNQPVQLKDLTIGQEIIFQADKFVIQTTQIVHYLNGITILIQK